MNKNLPEDMLKNALIYADDCFDAGKVNGVEYKILEAIDDLSREEQLLIYGQVLEFIERMKAKVKNMNGFSNNPDYIIPLEWFKYGLEIDDDYIIKFMMYWVAFNWFYSDGVLEDRKALELYCDKNLEKLKKFDAFGNKACKVLMEKAVGKGNNSPSYHQRELLRDLKARDVKALFLTMYQIRCNLFHGSKK